MFLHIFFSGRPRGRRGGGNKIVIVYISFFLGQQRDVEEIKASL